MNTQPLQQTWWYRGLILLGGGALFLAAAVDFFAVTGRHVGIPLLGSIELVQLLVGISGTVAMVAASLHGTHARVRLLLDRLSGSVASYMYRINALCGALFFLALSIGSAWLAWDLWSGHEETELWHLPYRPLRVVGVIGLLCVLLLFLRQIWRGPQR
jgi:TRAP-type transport system small permease protein